MITTFGIIGCGETAHSYAEAIEACEGAFLHGIYDTDCIKSTRLAEYSRARVYTEAYSLLQDENVNTIIICSPVAQRADYAIQAALAGKHIILEQPIALSLEQADRLLETVRRTGVTLSVAAPYRHRSSVASLKSALDQGLFGRLNHFNFTTRRSPMDAAYDIWSSYEGAELDAELVLQAAAGHLDLLLWLAGDVVEVSSYTTIRRSQIMFEDNIAVKLRFRGGALGIFEAVSTIIPGAREDTAAVFGDRGTALLGGCCSEEILRWNVGLDQTLYSPYPIPSTNKEPEPLTVYRPIVQNMLDVVNSGAAVLVDGSEGRRTLELIHSIRQIAGRAVPVGVGSLIG